ncbi:MAG: hypothetical protein O3A01_01475 [bacterium]|nr:hypothetical protein [bacterium]
MVILTGIYSVPVYSAIMGTGSSTANVTNIIDLQVTTISHDLGDIRTVLVADIKILELQVNNNDSDGYSITIHSTNGSSYPMGANQGHLVHESADAGATTNAGQRPSTPYSLSVAQNATLTDVAGGQFGTDDGDIIDDFLIDSIDHFISYLNATKATINGVFDVTLSQAVDPNLFHGVFTDTIQITIADI